MEMVRWRRNWQRCTPRHAAWYHSTSILCSNQCPILLDNSSPPPRYSSDLPTPHPVILPYRLSAPVSMFSQVELGGCQTGADRQSALPCQPSQRQSTAPSQWPVRVTPLDDDNPAPNAEFGVPFLPFVHSACQYDTHYACPPDQWNCCEIYTSNTQDRINILRFLAFKKEEKEVLN